MFNQGNTKPEIVKKGKASTLYAIASISKGKQQNNASSVKCICCSESHKIYQYRKFRSLTLSERMKIVMTEKLCKVCLNTGQMAYRGSLGIKCKKKDCGSTGHNTLLHSFESHADTENVKGNCSKPDDVFEAKTLVTLSQLAIAGHKRSVYLDIVPVKIVAGDTAVHTYALLDSGSDRTFCERCLADELSLRASPVKLAVQTMTPGNPHVLNTAVVSFNLSSLSNSYSTNCLK